MDRVIGFKLDGGRRWRWKRVLELHVIKVIIIKYACTDPTRSKTLPNTFMSFVGGARN